jgi:hypothetical protein
MTPRLAILALLPPLAAATGCTPKIQEQYRIEIVGALNQNYLSGATTAVLEVNDKVLSTTGITPGAAFSLTGSGLDLKVNMSAVFRFKALDAQGTVVAHGQSPEIELILATPPVVRLFIQKPGTFARSFDLDYGRRNMVAVVAPANVGVAQAKKIDVAFFGLGDVTVPGDTANTTVERPSEVLKLYNPITQIIDDAGTSSALGGIRQPRTGAAATVKTDGRVLLFGGEVAATDTTPARTSGQLDVVQIDRTDFDVFSPSYTVRNGDAPGVARRGSVMVHTDVAYAIGGRAGDQPLDTAVAIDPAVDATFKILPAHLAGPREGHTATPVNIPGGGQEVLVFGGAPANVAVAEVLVAGQMFVPVVGNAGPPRRDHAAVLLPSKDRVLIVGGQNDSGVLGDSLVYEGRTKSVGAGGITLKRARRNFAAFVVGDELVVAGGFGPDGAPVPTAEVYDASTLQARDLDVPAHPRAGASVAVLPNLVVLLLGGTEADPMMAGMLKASSVVELYQPRVLR